MKHTGNRGASAGREDGGQDVADRARGGQRGSQPCATCQERCVGRAGRVGSLCLQPCDRAVGEHAPHTAGLATSPAGKLHPCAQENPWEGSKTPKPARERIAGTAATQDPAGDAIGAGTATSPSAHTGWLRAGSARRQGWPPAEAPLAVSPPRSPLPCSPFTTPHGCFPAWGRGEPDSRTRRN